MRLVIVMLEAIYVLLLLLLSLKIRTLAFKVIVCKFGTILNQFLNGEAHSLILSSSGVVVFKGGRSLELLTRLTRKNSYAQLHKRTLHK
jgi:hypothetical protein